MKPVTPKVHLLSRPQVNWEGVHDYLRSINGIAWLDRVEGTEAEKLIEFAGRSCYRSWEPGLNPNVTKVREDSGDYLRNIINVGHGCYDAETDVLTRRGWIAWPDVQEDDVFATRSPEGRLEWHPAARLVNYTHRGRMYRVEARGVDLLVTPDHKMLVCLTTTREGRQRDDFQLITAEELGHRSHAYVKTAEWLGGEDILTSDEASLLGFAIGDGYCKGKVVAFHLRRERKVAWLYAVCDRLNLEVKRSGDRYRVRLDGRLFDYVSNMYDTDGSKLIPFDLAEASKSTLVGLFAGLMESDGHRGRTCHSYDTTSELLVDQIQTLAMMIGVAANASPCDREHSYGDRPLTRLNVIRRELRPEVNKFIDHVGRTSWIDDWEGEVFCAWVPPHNTLYVRRAGKPVWSGNSVLEHAQFSFMFQNLSRVATHELVRHRVGVAISQESLRYVRLADLNVWLPEALKADFDGQPPRMPGGGTAEEAIISMVEQLEVLQSDLAKAFRLDEDGVPFEYKKAVTSAMRRIAPIGLGTSMVWSANIRTLRHVLEMRTSRHAEEEVRLIFDQVGQIMQAEAPMLFDDYNVEEVNGYNEWTTESGKV
jgi:flavin-dependent thymidylate synthase